MLSTKSGGAGINLACANKVIIFDSSFNPQDDIQAENRAHRVGQTREVEVIRLVTRGTIEEQIHALGISKLALDDMVAGDVAPSEGKISDADEKGIEAVEEMIMAEFRKEDSGVGSAEEDGDLKDQYLNGLKTAGLDLSAA
jgi:SWI/SNF-related matrix-associated actin-dependent regulator 1 of chromatin subfamily A